MSSHRHLVTSLPKIDKGYEDEHGHIDHEVYAEAAALWPTLYRYAMKLTTDETQAWDLLVRTVARVSQRRIECGEILNLRAYVLTVFRRLVVDEMKLNKRLSDRLVIDIEYEVSIDDELNRSILIRQLFRRMDPLTRQIFELVICGFSFPEIVEKLNQDQKEPRDAEADAAPLKEGHIDPAVLRNKFRRRMIRLAEDIKNECEVLTEDNADLPYNKKL